jgi:hypothetical protein
MLVLLAACGTPTPTQVALAPSVMPKLLATVYISPTPNQAEQEATRGASPPTETPPPLVSSPQPTPYIGVFLGEAQNDDGGPVIDPSLLNNLPTTPTSSFDGSACTIPPDAKLGTTWTTDSLAVSRLGCPIEYMASYKGTLRIFERGVMYWRPTGEIWAVSPAAGRYWYAPTPLPPPPTLAVPPPGLRTPSQNFSAVWSSVPGVQDALGFAQTDEQEADLATQRFSGGTLLLDSSSGQVFVLFGDSTLGGPF